MKPLDKKQIPQVVAMAVLAVLFFGYFAFKMIMPTPAAAGTHVPTAPATAEAPRSGTAPTAVADPAAAQLVAAPPTAGLRDPFVPSISDQPAPPPVAPTSVAPPAARTVALPKPVHPFVPDAPSLPTSGMAGQKGTTGVASLPVTIRPAVPLPPAPPTWVVTGVLQSGGEKVAILRSGDARRFVKQGDLVDSTFRVAAVTRDAVVLKHGASRFTLSLGGSKAVPAARTVASPANGGPTPAATAADFTLNTLDGKPVSLSSYPGHVVVLDFWASWCDWCKKGMPQVQTLYSRFGPKGLSVLSINSWDKRDAMQAFVQANPQYTSTMLYDPSPEAQSVASSQFGVKGIPYTVVIDRQGRVAAAFDGYSPNGEERLETVLAGLGLRRSAPDIARAVKPRLRKIFASHLKQVAFTPRSMFAFSAHALTVPLVTAPKMTRRVVRHAPVCPVIRVADYRVEQSGTLFPSQGRGLLSSGMDAPDFSLSTLDGQNVSLSQFQGSAVVLGFWASWDTASMKMLNWLQGLQTQVGHGRLTVLAVNSWDSKSAMRAALQGNDWDLTMLFDPSVSNASIAVRAYRAPDVPTFYVIDQQGQVAGAFVGSSRNTTNTIKATLARLGVL